MVVSERFKLSHSLDDYLVSVWMPGLVVSDFHDTVPALKVSWQCCFLYESDELKWGEIANAHCVWTKIMSVVPRFDYRQPRDSRN